MLAIWRFFHTMRIKEKFNKLVMKVKHSLKKSELRNGEFLVKRKGRIYRINKKDPRRKARQGS